MGAARMGLFHPLHFLATRTAFNSRDTVWTVLTAKGLGLIKVSIVFSRYPAHCPSKERRYEPPAHSGC